MTARTAGSGSRPGPQHAAAGVLLAAGRPRSVASIRRRGSRALAGLFALGVLAACAGPGTPPDAPPGSASRPAERVADGDAGLRNRKLAAYYAGVESNLAASGRLRRDVAPADAPYTADDLVRNFERIAFFDEYVNVDGRFVTSETPATLRRWSQPVRVGIMTGPSAPAEYAARDRGNVAAFTRRLGRLTGLDMDVSTGPDVNFLMLFMNVAEQTAFADQVARAYPDFAPAVLGALRNTPPDVFCAAYSFGDLGDPSLYSAVIVLIPTEHPPFTRLSCVQEEMAQAMGLPNDSRDARPSIFNDSLEFALLTEHDEILLRMLYDPRLRPGMTAAEARPLLPAIARDAMAAQFGRARIARAAPI